MLSVAAASRDGRRVTKTARTQDLPVKEVGFERSGLSPAFLVLMNENIPRVIEGAGDPERPSDRVEQSGDFDWGQEELEALRQGRETVEHTPSTDSVRVYLTQIGKTALLNAQQEVDLAKRIEAGLFAAEWVRRAQDTTDKLAPQLHRDLCWIVRDGERAKNHLLEANLRLVVSVAKRYTGHGVLLLDLIQEGNLGLIRAVEKFDYTKGCKFSTYATWWVRSAISRVMADQARTIRIPAGAPRLPRPTLRTRPRTSQARTEDLDHGLPSEPLLSGPRGLPTGGTCAWVTSLGNLSIVPVCSGSPAAMKVFGCPLLTRLSSTWRARSGGGRRGVVAPSGGSVSEFAGLGCVANGAVSAPFAQSTRPRPRRRSARHDE